MCNCEHNWRNIASAIEDDTDKLFLARHLHTGNVFAVVGSYSIMHQDWSVHVDHDAVITHWMPIPPLSAGAHDGN